MTSIGVLMGTALNQMTMNLINVLGWRNYFYVLGGGWTIFGVILLVLV